MIIERGDIMDRDDERRQQEERKLAQLIINNPELEVLCLCDGECGDVSDPKDPADLGFDALNLLEAVFGEYELERMTKKEAFENFQNIEWTSCIAVRISPS